MQNYYDLATLKHNQPLRDFILPVSPDSLVEGFEHSVHLLARVYVYTPLIDPEHCPPGIAGWHSHFPRQICVVTEGVKKTRQLKTLCHEIAHCVQSRAVESLYSYKHQGEIARDFDTYLRYEIAADALAYEIFEQYFQEFTWNPGGAWYKKGFHELDSKNFQSYSNTKGVCRLYRKWAMKMRRKGYMT